MVSRVAPQNLYPAGQLVGVISAPDTAVRVGAARERLHIRDAA